MTKYVILTHEDEIELSGDINLVLSNRWSLYGSPFVKGDLFCQAVVKLERENALPTFIPGRDRFNIVGDRKDN